MYFPAATPLRSTNTHSAISHAIDLQLHISVFPYFSFFQFLFSPILSSRFCLESRQHRCYVLHHRHPPPEHQHTQRHKVRRSSYSHTGTFHMFTFPYLHASIFSLFHIFVLPYFQILIFPHSMFTRCMVFWAGHSSIFPYIPHFHFSTFSCFHIFTFPYLGFSIFSIFNFPTRNAVY